MARQSTVVHLPHERRVDNWLLDAAAYAAPSLSTILLDETELRQEWADFRTEMAGWTAELMERRLVALLQYGLISIINDDEHGRERSLTQAALEIYLDDLVRFEKADLYYRLSDIGAGYWESLFRPDWGTFFRTRRTMLRNEIQVVLLKCGSAELRDSLISNCFEYMSLDREFGLQQVKYGESSFWRPVYWKQLPKCYYIRFTSRECNRRSCQLPNFATTLFKPWGRDWPSDGMG